MSEPHGECPRRFTEVGESVEEGFALRVVGERVPRYEPGGLPLMFGFR